MACEHEDVSCINPYELIRKYRCASCGGVMMCACDRERGEKFLPHQLRQGKELKTQARVPVTAGFQPKICEECRGKPPQAHPRTAIPGRTSKIKRYYWRELAFREMELVAASDHLDDEHAAQLQEQALNEIKELHETSPKYVFTEPSQQTVINDYDVETVDLRATYVRASTSNRARVVHGSDRVGVEEFVRRHFARDGYDSLELESRPFHALFGVLLSSVIQDSTDAKVREVGFGSRDGTQPSPIWTPLPEDFGTAGYWIRRAAVVEAEVAKIIKTGLVLAFDDRVEQSAYFLQYLWAHDDMDVKRARRILGILPADCVHRILTYLAQDYWGRYLGWPDLLFFRERDFFFAEVKGSGDKLSDDQKEWISGNHDSLKLPFKLVKIHRVAVVGE